MLQTISSGASAELRAYWPEIKLLSQKEVFANPASIRKAFDDTEHSAVIVECPPLDVHARELFKMRSFKVPDPSGNGKFATIFTFSDFDEYRQSTDEPLSKISRTVATKLPNIEHLSPEIAFVIAADLVTLHHAFGANGFKVECIVEDKTSRQIHQDLKAAIALRTFFPADETTILYKDREFYEGADGTLAEADGTPIKYDDRDMIRPPAHSLTLLKQIYWGTLRKEYEEEGDAGVPLIHGLGLPHTSPDYPGMRLAVRYLIDGDHEALKRMHNMQRRLITPNGPTAEQHQPR